MESHPFDLPAALNTAETIARQAGAILRQYYERPRQADHKKTSIDLVTEADRTSEAFIVPALRAAFPDHHIAGEEGGGYGPPRELTPYHWHVDPLDGTTNFAHRVPHFAVSLALSDPDLRPILGVVYDPMRDECFKGVRGQGAALNGRPSPCRLARSSPVSVPQTRSTPSQLPVASKRPSGLNSTQSTICSCPGKRDSSWPVAAS